MAEVNLLKKNGGEYSKSSGLVQSICAPRAAFYTSDPKFTRIRGLFCPKHPLFGTFQFAFSHTSTSFIYMNNASIFLQIEQAKQHEAATGQVAAMLAGRIENLHPRLTLPDKDLAPALKSFVECYIDRAPHFFSLLDTIGQDDGLAAVILPVAERARSFFEQPPESVGRHGGMLELLNKAYLAHRLMEEFNDYIIINTGAPLFDMEITRSNLLIHHLIGEPLANQLDQVIEEICSELQLPATQAPAAQLSAALARLSQHSSFKVEQWPCMIDRLSLQSVLRQVMAS